MENISNQDKIVIGIHTTRFAQTLVAALKTAGIQADLAPFNANVPGAGDKSSASRLMNISVPIQDLIRGVEIQEEIVGADAYKLDLKMAGMNETLLIPVDFSSLSMMACKVGFELAERLNLKPIIMHAFTSPSIINSGSDNPFPTLVNGSDEIENMELEQSIQSVANSNMNKFKEQLQAEIAAGRIADISYETSISEGTPEDVILEFTRFTPPALVVMATRGKDKKDKELIGSVTAEVLDSCRVPVFTVPENYPFNVLQEIKKLAFFCNLDGRDVKSMEFLMRMFNYPEVDIILLAACRKLTNDENKLNDLNDFFKACYPECKFDIGSFQTKELRSEFEKTMTTFGIEMLIVPNKKSNVFARLFNPGIPHRILFERDIPMLALPV